MLDLDDFYKIKKEDITEQLRNVHAKAFYQENLRGLYRRWNGRLRDWIKGRLDIGNELEAEDAAHHIWRQVLDHLIRDDRPNSIPWVFILQREVSRFLRLNERRYFKKELQLPDAHKIAEVMLETLPPFQANAFRLFYLLGGELDEIGHVLNAPACGVERALSKARLNLQINFYTLALPPQENVSHVMAIKSLLTICYKNEPNPERRSIAG